MKQTNTKRIRPTHVPTLYTSYDEIPDYLMVKDVADVLRISVASAYHLVRQKDFPLLLLNSQMRVEKQSFITWLEGKERK